MMASQTDTTASASDSVRAFRSDSIYKTESSNTLSKKINYNETNMGSTTECVDEFETIRIVENPSTRKGIIPVAAQVGIQPHVMGSVIDVDDWSVRCEVEMEGGLEQLQLPRSLFLEHVEYGSRLKISVDQNDGFKAPVIEVVREEDLWSETEEYLEALALVNDL
ncbi:hypothetical protein Q6D67_18655 [Haliea sp. E1-2-M8]|uniref:hypothetical protein n=1 Tax=Haliea sp. E1-2-M8 TaxID=3064706 RepID=UPI00271D2E1F|nr:hypothetical protein [Haliea sp. E1-2-M8]MDO8863717.1 hypothetical protein [Haliea sp. E1-2-M8]